MSKFGWSYPPGAENDPFAPYNDDGDEPPVTFERETDPYGHLTYAVGTDDDFTCFDYVISDCKQFARLHAVINSETGSFIQNASDPVEVPLNEAVAVAQNMVDEAIEWLHAGGGPAICHDAEGWNQDAGKFVQDVKGDCQPT